MKLKNILALLLAIMMTATMLFGCDKDADDKDDEYYDDDISVSSEKDSDDKETDDDEDDDSSEEQSSKPISNKYINIIDDMSASEHRSLNIFLSNFAESRFTEYNRKNEPDYYSLIGFAYTHNLINTKKTFFEGEYMGISEKNANATIEKYFGITVPKKTAVDDFSGREWEYSDGNFLSYAASGAAYGYFAVAESMVDNGNGTYSVAFDKFSAPSPLDAVPSECYDCDVESALHDYDYICSGKAVVKKKTYNGKETYELVKYQID